MASPDTRDGYPIDLIAVYPESPSRLLALLGALFFFKAILLIPHFIVLYFLQIAAAIAIYIGYWVVVFTGRYPRSLFNFTVGVQRWNLRITAWMAGWADSYPPFSL